MANNIEWCAASNGAGVADSDDLPIGEAGLGDGEIGVWLGTDAAAVLYGAPEDIIACANEIKASVQRWVASGQPFPADAAVEDDDEPPLVVPYPPTTVEQAEAWVRWAETEIGLGWHPDTPGSDLEQYNRIGLEARCACGETFNPCDIDDTVHGQREDGEDCGLRGVIVGHWGSGKPLFPVPDVRARYDAGLAAAHELLPDIYATSMTIFKELHPELLPDQGKDTP